ncbi:hypothetical protein J28TS4_51610 [Paenibacillus lautus]|nr:hypothetical protein J28TS4_51610 [Paenibacillus lautus]
MLTVLILDSQKPYSLAVYRVELIDGEIVVCTVPDIALWFDRFHHL